MSKRKALKSNRQSHVVIRSRHRPQKTCGGPNTPDKIRHAMMSDALRAIQSQEAQGRKQWPYQCRDCDGWHLTSQFTPTPVVGASKGNR